MKVQTLFDHTWKRLWNTERYQKSGWGMEVWKYWQGHLAKEFGHRDHTKVTLFDVKKFHRGLLSKPVTANRCVEVLSRVYSFCGEEGIITPALNPCRQFKGYREPKRSRYASVEELQRIGVALDGNAKRFPIEANFVRVLLLTGIRPRALMTARHDDIVVVKGVGVLTAAGKATEDTGDEDVTVLSATAMNIIRTLPKRADGLVFGNVRYREFWQSVRSEARCPDLWLRDMRRTFSTIGRSAGVSMDSIADLLNHRSVQTTKIYARVLPLDQIRAAEKVSRRLSLLLGGKA